MQKFISFSVDPLRPFDLKDKTKWQKVGKTETYKLLNPDIDKDRQFFTAEIKAVKAIGTDNARVEISGIANANIVDRVQERVDPRGLDLINFLKNPVILAHHSYYHPIGQVETLDIQEDGIHFAGWVGDSSLASLTEMQNEIRSLIMQSILKTVSIGFIPKQIRAPLFGENGELQEPCVIEEWELLELSVVSVPCNQDSIFQVRDYAKTFDSAKLISNASTYKKVAPEKNLVVQALIFSKDLFTKDQATKFIVDAKEEYFNADKFTENKSHLVAVQIPINECNEDSSRIVTLFKGVQAVTVKKKDGTTDTSTPASDNQDANTDNEMITLMRSTADKCSKIYDMCDAMYQKMDAKPSSDAGGEKPKPDPAAADNSGKVLSDRVERMEKSVERIAQAVKMLVDKTAK